MALLLAAISLGFLGSFHCIGMCGPIALSLPVHQKPPAQKTLLILLYNLGRMISYAVLGSVVGLVGQSIAFAGYQQALSISIGLLLLAGLFLPRLTFLQKKTPELITRIFSGLRRTMGHFLRQGKTSALFVLGLMNGFLPCGLVYMGLAGAAATGSWFEGALFMFVFGSGTVPVMLSLPLAGSFISVNTRNQIRKTVPLVIGLTATLLILRGMNLGIPYVSPAIHKNEKTISCHPNSQLKNTITCSGQNSQHKK